MSAGCRFEEHANLNVNVLCYRAETHKEDRARHRGGLTSPLAVPFRNTAPAQASSLLLLARMRSAGRGRKLLLLRVDRTYGAYRETGAFDP